MASRYGTQYLKLDEDGKHQLIMANDSRYWCWSDWSWLAPFNSWDGFMRLLILVESRIRKDTTLIDMVHRESNVRFVSQCQPSSRWVDARNWSIQKFIHRSLWHILHSLYTNSRQPSCSLCTLVTASPCSKSWRPQGFPPLRPWHSYHLQLMVLKNSGYVSFMFVNKPLNVWAFAGSAWDRKHHTCWHDGSFTI